MEGAVYFCLRKFDSDVTPRPFVQLSVTFLILVLISPVRLAWRNSLATALLKVHTKPCLGQMAMDRTWKDGCKYVVRTKHACGWEKAFSFLTHYSRWRVWLVKSATSIIIPLKFLCCPKKMCSLQTLSLASGWPGRIAMLSRFDMSSAPRIIKVGGICTKDHHILGPKEIKQPSRRI
jgi:hypothetical protein